MNEITKNEEQVKMLAAEQPWNHNFTLPGGVQTSPGKQSSHGKNLVKLERLKPIFNTIGLAGKSVLDVGCNEGFFSIHMAENQASVLGVDIDKHRIKKARFVKDTFDKNLDVNFDQVDIYSKKFEDLPKADLCLCLGFIHRVPDPYRAIAAIANKTDLIIFEWKALKFGPHDEPFAYFSQKGVDHGDFYGTEYWLLSYAALESVLRRENFKFFHRIDDPSQRRAIIVAGKVHNPIFDQKDSIKKRNLVRVIASQGKRMLRTLIKVFSGTLNA